MSVKIKSTLPARLICLFIAFCMLVPLFSCAESNENSGESDTNNDDSNSVISESETTVFDDGLEEHDYGGQTVTIVSRYMENWTAGEITVEELNSEIVNDAVYNRELFVEDRLHIDLQSEAVKTTDANGVIVLIENANKSGDLTYDICANACFTTLASVIKGNFRDLVSADTIDLSRIWWSQGYNEAISFNEAQYTALGPMVLSQYRFAFATIFNKNVFTEKNTPFLYETVSNYEWTLDKQYELAVQLANVNDIADQDSDSNFYGFVTNNYLSTDPYWSSCEVDILKKNSDGEYELVFETEKLSNVCDKLIKLYYESGATRVFPWANDNEEQTYIRNVFTNSKAAMATMRLLELETADMRNMTDEYGVAPMPMYDEAQHAYHTLLHDQFTVICVPSAANDDELNRAGAVIEAMSSYGYQYVIPAYYETALKCKYMSDSASWEMLDIISNNIYIDPGIIYTDTLNGFHANLREIMVSKKNTVASRYKSKLKACQKALTNLHKKLNKLES